MPESGLRIAIFTDSYFPIQNGVSVSIDALVRGLRDQGHSVHIFTSDHPLRARDEDANIHRFRSVETPFSRGYPLAYPPYYRMLQVFRRTKFDLVHTHTPFILGFVGLRWAESHDLPIVSTYHTLYDRYSHYLRFLPRRYVRFRIAKHTHFYYSKVDHVITPSETASKWLSRHSVSTPVTVIPTGVAAGPVFDRSELRLAHDIGPDQKIMLYLGRLAREKNLELLFEATAILFRLRADLKLWLVGDGPYREQCADLVRRYGIGDRVRFVGPVPQGETDKYYAMADLFTFPSISETQGLVVLEAMSYGLPSVTVGGGGACEAIDSGKDGIVVGNDPQAFADACAQILDSDELASRLSRGALRTARNQSPEQMVEKVVQVYKDLLQMKEQRQEVHV